MSLQGLNLCINYSLELNEGAGAPQTAFASIRKHCTHIWLHVEIATKASFWGVREALGSRPLQAAQVEQSQARLPFSLWVDFQANPLTFLTSAVAPFPPDGHWPLPALQPLLPRLLVGLP